MRARVDIEKCTKKKRNNLTKRDVVSELVVVSAKQARRVRTKIRRWSKSSIRVVGHVLHQSSSVESYPREPINPRKGVSREKSFKKTQYIAGSSNSPRSTPSWTNQRCRQRSRWSCESASVPQTQGGSTADAFSSSRPTSSASALSVLG